MIISSCYTFRFNFNPNTSQLFQIPYVYSEITFDHIIGGAASIRFPEILRKISSPLFLINFVQSGAFNIRNDVFGNRIFDLRLLSFVLAKAAAILSI